MDLLSTLIGVAGVISITAGILIHDRVKEDILYVIGGVLLLVYSTILGDPVFIALQLIFIAAACYDLYRSSKVGR